MKKIIFLVCLIVSANIYATETMQCNFDSALGDSLDEKISAHPALIDEFEEERLWLKPSFHYHQTPEILQRHSRVAAY